MKVLMITGDKNFKPGHERYDLQSSAVENLTVVYWGRTSTWPKIPEGEFDVVTAQDPFGRGLFGWWVATRIGAKLNVQVHTDLSAYVGLRRLVATFVLTHADSVRVVSEKIKKQVQSIGVTAKITVLPVFVDVSTFSEVVHREHSQPTILWVGRFEKEKDPIAAISVFEEVLKSVPHAKLVLLGSGSLHDRLVERAHGSPVVEIIGWESPLPHLSTADVVLSTSVHESFGASMVEALAAGVPVVAPDVGVAKEAGANVVGYQTLASEVVKVLQAGQKGTLQLNVLTKETWAQKWKETLL